MEQHTTIDHLLDQLERAGKRSTPQRHAVCQALVEHGGHPTVADIFERVRIIFPMISQATVYNTVDTLEELGLVHRVDITNHEHTHYDLDATPHINLVCTHCTNIVDLHLAELSGLLLQIGQQTGYQIALCNSLVVYGVCPDCLAQGVDHCCNGDVSCPSQTVAAANEHKRTRRRE